MFCKTNALDLWTLECVLYSVYVPIIIQFVLLKIFVIIQPGLDFTFLILVKVLALSENIGHFSLALFFRGVISGMNAHT